MKFNTKKNLLVFRLITLILFILLSNVFLINGVFAQTDDSTDISRKCFLYNNLNSIESSNYVNLTDAYTNRILTYFPSIPDNQHERLIIVNNCILRDTKFYIIVTGTEIVCDTYHYISVNPEQPANLDQELRSGSDDNQAGSNRVYIEYRPGQEITLYKSQPLIFDLEDDNKQEADFLAYLYEFESGKLKRVQGVESVEELDVNKVYFLKKSEIEDYETNLDKSKNSGFSGKSIILNTLSSSADLAELMNIAQEGKVKSFKFVCDESGFIASSDSIGPQELSVDDAVEQSGKDFEEKKSDISVAVDYYNPFDKSCGYIGKVCCSPEEVRFFHESDTRMVGFGIISKVPFIGDDIANYLEDVREYTGEIIDRKFGESRKFSGEQYCLQGVPVVEYKNKSGKLVRRMLKEDDVKGRDIANVRTELGCRCSDRLDSKEPALLTASFNYCNNLNNTSLTNKCYNNIDQCSKSGGFYSALGCISPSLEGLFGLSSGILLSLAGIFSILCLVYAGFLVQTSSGNADQVSKAKQTAVRCLTGLLVIIFAGFLLDMIFRVIFEDTIFKFLLF